MSSDGFFVRDENPFEDLDREKGAAVIDAEDELETNDVQFKALKQDVLLQLFRRDSCNEEFLVSQNLFTVSNRQGYFACAHPNGITFGTTESLRQAFDEAKPKSTATLKNSYTLEFGGFPTHLQFSADGKYLLVSFWETGLIVLDTKALAEKKPRKECETATQQARWLLNLLPNPSPLRSNLVAFIERTTEEDTPNVPFGTLFLYDISTRKRKDLLPGKQFTCMTFSSDGETLMACSRTGEAVYFNLVNQEVPPIRRPPPSDLPEPEGDSWWIVQAVHWIDTYSQLVIYNPLTHPSDPPTHEYQAYIISNPTHLPSLATFKFEYIKLPTPPVDAFGNTSLHPWFWFQSLHAWKPSVQDLIICSVTAGSDIGLVGRTPDASNSWRIWITADENRRATIPYDMEHNEETIVTGMQLDFTATKTLEKPLYPDENPAECDALPLLWVLNNKGQLAGWTVMYIPGIKDGQRCVDMMPLDWQITYWHKQKEDRMKKTIDEEEKHDKEIWEARWKAQQPQETEEMVKDQESGPSSTIQKDSEPPVMQTPAKPSVSSTSKTPSTNPVVPISDERPFSSPAAANKPSTSPTPAAFPASNTTPAFGQLGQLGASPLNQSPFVNTSMRSASGSGFGKYLSSGNTGSGFLGGQTSGSSFLDAAKGSGFPKGGSFLDSSQPSAFSKGQDQGFAKYASSSGGFGSSGTSSHVVGGSTGFLSGPRDSANTSAATPTFGVPPKGSLSERTQSYASSGARSGSYEIIDDESSDADSEVEESESESEDNVRVDVSKFGDTGLSSLNLGDRMGTETKAAPARGLTPSKEPSKESAAPTINTSHESASSVADSGYVKIGLPPAHGSTKPLEKQAKEVSPPTNLKPVPPPATKLQRPSDGKSIPVPTAVSQRSLDTVKTPAFQGSGQPGAKTPSSRTPAQPKTSASTPVTKEPQSLPSESSELSDAFRLVLEQVTKELAKLSDSATNLAAYVESQSQSTGSDISIPEAWKLGDIPTMSKLVDTNMGLIEGTGSHVPIIDETVKEIETSLKKMEAKKIELERFVQAVKDPDVKESTYSRKLAPDFARQQKEIRHALQEAEDKLHDLVAALTILKADLADERSSFGVQSPSTAGIYRVINNVFSRLQLLSTKVAILESKAEGFVRVRLSTPSSAGSPGSMRSTPAPKTPITPIARIKRQSPASRTPSTRSPAVKGSPLRKTMLDEKADPWEVEEIIRDWTSKQQFQRKIGDLLKKTRPHSSEVKL